MSDTKLVGYVRKSLSGNALKMHLSWEALMDAERYVGKDGREYVGLIMKADRIKDIINGEKEVTSVTQICDGFPSQI